MTRWVFADTGFLIGLLRKRDQFHSIAVAWKNWVERSNVRILTTEAVLWES